MSFNSIADPKTSISLSIPSTYLTYPNQNTQVPLYSDSTGNDLIYSAGVAIPEGASPIEARVLHNDGVTFKIGGGRPEVPKASDLTEDNKSNEESNPDLLWVDSDVFIENVGTGFDII